MTNSITTKTRLALAASISICAVITGLSAPASAADTAAPSAMAQPNASMNGKMMRNESPEDRIKHLHDLLKITADQEPEWNRVAQVMLDNASAIASAIKDRTGMAKGMTAIDDLRSYQAIVEAHAEGIKKLAIAFKPLYATMPEGQQKNADAVFAHRTEPSRLKKHA
jgi:protein CpxP